MKIAAIILNWNQATLTEAAARSVRTGVDEVIVVDNASRPDERAALLAWIRASGDRVLLLDSNRGYAGGNNAGIAEALASGFDGIFILNSDAVVSDGAVDVLRRRLEARADVAAVMPAVVSIPGGDVLHVECALDLSTGQNRWIGGGTTLEEANVTPRESGYVSGEAFLARADVFRSCGLFDERFFCYFEDSEWSVRVRRAGWALEAIPSAVVGHHLHGSSGGVTAAYYMARNRPLFLSWGLGKSRWDALALSAPRELVLVASLLRRRRWREAMRGALLGWLVGWTRVLVGR